MQRLLPKLKAVHTHPARCCWSHQRLSPAWTILGHVCAVVFSYQGAHGPSISVLWKICSTGFSCHHRSPRAKLRHLFLPALAQLSAHPALLLLSGPISSSSRPFPFLLPLFARHITKPLLPSEPRKVAGQGWGLERCQELIDHFILPPI